MVYLVCLSRCRTAVVQNILLLKYIAFISTITAVHISAIVFLHSLANKMRHITVIHADFSFNIELPHFPLRGKGDNCNAASFVMYRVTSLKNMNFKHTYMQKAFTSTRAKAQAENFVMYTFFIALAKL